MAGPLYMSSHVVGANSAAARPGFVAGTFTANGASSPTVVGGATASVRRLVDGGALPFFRVRLSGAVPFDSANTSITLTVRPADPAAPVYALDVLDKITASPADTRRADEFDVALYSAADARVDTAGTRISFQIVFDS